MTPDTEPPRPGEELPIQGLSEYLRPLLPLGENPLVIEQFPGGHSNLTYLLRFGECELVLRRPPLGPVAPTAHDMVREYRLLKSVHAVFPLAPRPCLLCEDTGVLGAPFYLMERRCGLVVRRELPPELASQSPEVLTLRRSVSEAVVDTLADLHAINIYERGLTGLGKPDGMLVRHIRGWIRRWEAAKTREIPAMDGLAIWLFKRLPKTAPQPTLIHNDYKLDNVMLSADNLARVVAVFDWEMATVGDPLVDLGIFLSYWPQAGDPETRREAISGVTALPGWLTRAEIVERYARRTAFDVSHVSFYETYALFKVAVILQQIYFRYHEGQTHDPRFADFENRVIGLAEAAMDLASGS
ncbi:MAG TPA: phosphotransferase family protein [Bryobacterales bacterium]|nr:phosphotransferase family protein [Bryobacterales bacterium]